MTVIVYREGIMAADRLISGYGSLLGEQCKLNQLPNGWIFGATGNCSDDGLFAEFLLRLDEAGNMMGEAKRPQLENEDFLALLGTPRGDVLMCDRMCHPFFIKAPFYAIGSGADTAKGAMCVGADATTAVLAASQVRSNCGGGVDVLVYDQKQRKWVWPAQVDKENPAEEVASTRRGIVDKPLSKRNAAR